LQTFCVLEQLQQAHECSLLSPCQLPDSSARSAPDVLLNLHLLPPFLQAPYVAYSNALKTRPLLTKACTSLVGFVLGDLIAQVRQDHFSKLAALLL
jgi:hypothetical protein